MLPLPALVEAYSVMTRLPPPWRLKSGDARDLLDRTFRLRAVVIGLEGAAGWELLDAAVGAGVRGGAVHDSHIAACAQLAGAARLATFNRRHFERLDLGEMELLVP